MSVFDTALAVLHADVNLSVAADYRQGGQGPASRVRVIRAVLEPDMAPFGLQLKARADTLSVRATVCPALAIGDSFTFDPDTTPTVAVIASAPVLDAEGITYTATLRRL